MRKPLTGSALLPVLQKAAQAGKAGKRKLRKLAVKKSSGASAAYMRGRRDGFLWGRADGYSSGWSAGKRIFSEPVEGTSIIIPTYNQRRLLQQCIDSIRRYTPEPHEIIVVDNGSNDGTVPYLKSMAGKLRIWLSPVNLGFAGGINQGLRMARGRTLLLLNNDTVVTRGWLRNLLACLHSSDSNGLAGPMTNYISGIQKLDTSYRTLTEMHKFAKGFNRSDPGKWVETSRIVGFCLLLKRELFRKLGYMDEGFKLGNCEDEDFALRVRLLGYRLAIAGDTFIHHVGSASMKSLGKAEFKEVYAHNQRFYTNKWGDIGRLLKETEDVYQSTGISLQERGMGQFYPAFALVKGPGPAVYWLKHGVRHPIVSEAWPEALPVIRVSQIDLWSWPVDEHVDLAAACAELHTASQYSAPSTAQSSIQSTGRESIANGVLVQAPDGGVYQIDRGKVRRFHTEKSIADWQMQHWRRTGISWEELSAFPPGLPILSPVQLRSDNL